MANQTGRKRRGLGGMPVTTPTRCARTTLALLEGETKSAPLLRGCKKIISMVRCVSHSANIATRDIFDAVWLSQGIINLM